MNEVFAKTYFGGENPVGRHFGLGGRANRSDLEIIGVSHTARLVSLNDDITPVV